MSHRNVGQLTLRGIPADLYRELRAEARRLGTSMNRIILDRILPPKKGNEGGGAELLSMAGTWSKTEAEDFERQIEGHRRIDPELWS